MKNRSKAAAAVAGLVLLGGQALAMAPGAHAATGTVVDRNLDTYTVFAQDGKVAIYQGVQQGIGPIGLSHLYEESNVTVDDLPEYDKQQVEQTINADDLQAAKTIVEQLSDAGRQ